MRMLRRRTSFGASARAGNFMLNNYQSLNNDDSLLRTQFNNLFIFIIWLVVLGSHPSKTACCAVYRPTSLLRRTQQCLRASGHALFPSLNTIFVLMLQKIQNNCRRGTFARLLFFLSSTICVGESATKCTSNDIRYQYGVQQLNTHLSKVLRHGKQCPYRLSTLDVKNTQCSISLFSSTHFTFMDY